MQIEKIWRHHGTRGRAASLSKSDKEAGYVCGQTFTASNLLILRLLGRCFAFSGSN